MTLDETLKNLLKTNKKYTDKDGDVIDEIVLKDIANQDKELIKLLLSNQECRENLFTDIDGYKVFDQLKTEDILVTYSHDKQSKTAYKNKIRLANKYSYITKYTDDVVLSYPFKDCTLIGGQTKDDQKGSEKFLNDVIDVSELHRLFEPKAFTNIKRISKDKVEPNPTITMDDNLIIKGNNLIALHSPT